MPRLLTGRGTAGAFQIVAAILIPSPFYSLPVQLKGKGGATSWNAPGATCPMHIRSTVVSVNIEWLRTTVRTGDMAKFRDLLVRSRC